MLPIQLLSLKLSTTRRRSNSRLEEGAIPIRSEDLHSLLLLLARHLHTVVLARIPLPGTTQTLNTPILRLSSIARRQFNRSETRNPGRGLDIAIENERVTSVSRHFCTMSYTLTSTSNPLVSLPRCGMPISRISFRTRESRTSSLVVEV